MKRYQLLLIATLFFGCIAERDIIVESDYSYRGKFKKYDTFNFMDSGDTVNFNGLSDNLIKREIERRLISQGYKVSDKPSLYIAYKVYGNNMSFKGYDQINLDSWDQLYAERAENEYALENIKEAKYNERVYELQEGTLLIDFIDRKNSSVIWQGYASGLFSDQSYFSKDVRYSVRSILNEYRLLAANYQ